MVYLFETINSFGVNITSTDCNGIPHLKVLSTPTKSSTSFVNVTEWRDNADVDIAITSIFSAPICSISTLAPHYYQRSQGIDQVGGQQIGGTSSGTFTANPIIPRKLGSVCPMGFFCKARINEVVLIDILA